MIEDKQFSIFLNTIKNNDLINVNDKVILGVSGGIDSICMLHFFVRLRQKYNLILKVVHINHMLREKESDSDQDFVKKLCEDYKIEFEHRKVNILIKSKKIKKTIEETAREERYSVFNNILIDEGFNKISVAHNSDDQSETVMMRIIRGTGISGLTGIKYKNNNIIRPLLDLTREDIINYIKTNNLKYVEDSSNKESIYTRNKIRLDLFPYIDKEFNCNIKDKIFKMSALVKEDKEIVDAYIETIYKDVVKQDDSDQIFIYIEKFLLYPEIILKRLIRHSIFNIRKNLVGIEQVHIEKIMDIIKSKKTGLKYLLPDRITIEIQYNYIKIYKDLTENIYEYQYQVEFPCKIKILEANIIFSTSINELNSDNLSEFLEMCNNYTQCFDYDLVHGGISIRSRKSGDFIYLSYGKKKLKQYYIDNKIPKVDREKMPLLTKENEIIWIIGHRANSKYFINKKTKRVLICNVKII